MTSKRKGWEIKETIQELKGQLQSQADQLQAQAIDECTRDLCFLDEEIFHSTQDFIQQTHSSYLVWLFEILCHLV